MNLIPPRVEPDPIDYPSYDGNRMSDNMKQARWIFSFYGNFAALLADRSDAFVAADNLWYPLRGRPEVRIGPDVYVVFGRPGGDRPSYKQWEEDGVPVTIAVEIRSPSNTDREMADKQAFYEEYGVEEYYDYDPDANRLRVYVRRGAALRRVRPLEAFVSPRLGCRFELTEPEMTVCYPDGRPFLSFVELSEQRDAEQQRAETAEQRAESERQRAESAEQRAESEQQRAEGERQRFVRLAELSRKARFGQASVDELHELQRLEEANRPPEA